MEELTERMDNLRAGGEIDLDAEMLNSGITVDNDNHPLPENYLNVTEEECVYENWGHSGICHQRQGVNVNQMPSLKVMNHSPTVSCSSFYSSLSKTASEMLNGWVFGF